MSTDVVIDVVKLHFQIVVIRSCSSKTEETGHTNTSTGGWITETTTFDLAKQVGTPWGISRVVNVVADIDQVIATLEAETFNDLYALRIGVGQINLQLVLSVGQLIFSCRG